MNIAYFNGKFIPKDDIMISPDDRGFLFADGIYEVMKWYAGFYYDMESHIVRMKRSLREVRIKWPEEDTFPLIAIELIKHNRLWEKQALIYIQVTRGAATRNHSFPEPEIAPTVYAFVREISSEALVQESVAKVMLKEDIRWSRCDIKSVALLANTLSFQEAHEKGLDECIFVRNGYITEGTRSNIFFIIGSTLYTHPESQHILSGVTRKNILRIANQKGIPVREEALSENKLLTVDESFITNTSAEVTPVTEINGRTVGNGLPGELTIMLRKIFHSEIYDFQS